MSGRAPRNRARREARASKAGADARPFGRILVLIAVAAFVLRLVYLAGASQSPLYRHPALDAKVNDAAAWDVARGATPAREPYFRPPLYGMFLAGVYGVAGHDLGAPRVAQAAAGAATAFLLGLLGASLWDRRVGIGAAALGALYGPSIYFDGELVSASLELFLAALSLWLFVEGARRGSRAWLVGAGVALAAASITRPTFLPFAIVGAWWLWTRVPHAAAALFLAAALSLPIAATVRNAAVSGDPVFIASQGGINFYIGNHARADGTTPFVPTLGSGVTATYDAPFREASRLAGRPLRASEVSGFWFRKGFDFWREYPREAATLAAKKIAMVWNRRELPNTQDQAFFAPFHSWLFRAPLLPGFALLAPIALAAAWFERRRASALIWFAATLTAVTAAFFVCDRFRFPLAAAVIPLAAAGLVRAWDAWRSRAEEQGGAFARRALPAGALLLAMGAFVWLPFPGWQSVETGMSWFRIATAYEQGGNAGAAGDAYARAEEAGLATPEFFNNYGLHALRADDLAAAVARFRRAVALDPSNGPALGNLAETYLRRGEWSPAAGAYVAAAGAMPEHAAEFLTNAGGLFAREGKLDAARQAYKDALASRPGFAPAAQALDALGGEDGHGGAGGHPPGHDMGGMR
jgi:4-amino-4-deoxy-L-arabinose transferase-like glycosyltransferase/Tfp pilus assembly protein PilF